MIFLRIIIAYLRKKANRFYTYITQIIEKVLTFISIVFSLLFFSIAALYINGDDSLLGIVLNTVTNDKTHTDESIFMHTYFYYPNDKEIYLGRVKGLSVCQRTSYNYAKGKGLDSYSNWSYICCTEENNSNCYRKMK